MTRLGLHTVIEAECKSKNWGGCREGWVRQIHQLGAICVRLGWPGVGCDMKDEVGWWETQKHLVDSVSHKLC